jgi:hypothetical protein
VVEETSATRDAVKRVVASGSADLVGLLQAACVLSRRGEENGTGVFAGRWVLQEWATRTGGTTWRPGGLRPLAAEGLIVNAMQSTRGGHRAYYRMPDREEIERTLAELNA